MATSESIGIDLLKALGVDTDVLPVAKAVIVIESNNDIRVTLTLEVLKKIEGVSYFDYEEKHLVLTEKK